ncbi:Coiled-coil domain-containing protein 17, partial [Entophlyctis luteolus]
MNIMQPHCRTTTATKEPAFLRQILKRQRVARVDGPTIVSTSIAQHEKIRHIESVMVSVLYTHSEPALFHHNLDSKDPWLRFHLRMLEFPLNSIQYDLDVLALHIGWTKSKREYSSTREWNMDLIFSLMLARKQSDEICHRLGLVLFKVHKFQDIIEPDEFSPIVREIQMYSKMVGETNLKQMGHTKLRLLFISDRNKKELHKRLMKEPKNRFSFERDKLAQERAKIQRELADLDKRFSAFAGPESATTDINLRRPSDDRNHDTDWLLPIVPLPSVIHEKLNPDNDVDLADENERLTDQVKSNSDLNATSILLREISAIRMDYLRSGGTNKLLLDQMNALEAQFTHLASGGQQASLDFADEERAEKDDPAFHPSTFDVIDLINIPPYEEHRGLSVFMDVITGIPYYGGGSVVKMDLSYTVFNGSVVASPVESAIAMCSRKALSFTGRSVVQDFQRFFDASSLTVSFEGVKFFYKEGLIDEREMIPVAWTAIDLFQENLELNQGRWRVSMFYPPVDFNITTYHLHETVPPIPNMQFYMRIVNPILQPHHRRVDITQVDVRVNATVSTEYLFYKPLYNVFDYYDQMSDPNLKDRGDGSLMGSRSNLGAGGSLLGSKMLGSSASMDVKPLQYCRVGIRVDEITNLFVDVGSSDIFAVVTVGTTIVDWRSPPAEEGFTSGSYGWSEDTAELWVDAVIDLETKVSLGIAVNENENGQPGLTEELAIVNLFLQTENDTPVLNEGTFLLQARLSDSSYCTLNVKIFVADTRPPPYNFESTRLSRPIPYGAFFKIGDDPNVERSPYTAILGPFDLHIDGVRFLPESCTVTRIQCSIVDRGGAALDEFEKAEGFCDLQSPAFFPQFDISARVKPYKSSGTVTAATRVNGTLTAVIKIFTIDMYTQQLLTVGIAFFNLFLASPPVADAHDPTQNNWPQPESANVQPIYLNEGYHQVPVFVWNEKTKMKATFVGACKTNK